MESWQELIDTHLRIVNVSSLSKITRTAETALHNDLSELQADTLASSFLFKPISALDLVRLLEDDSVWIKPLCDIFRVITLLIEKYPIIVQKYLPEINVTCEVSSSARVKSAALQCQAAAVRAGLRVKVGSVVTALREEKAARAARALLIGMVCKLQPEALAEAEPIAMMGALLQIIAATDTSEAVTSAALRSVGALVSKCGLQLPSDQITQLHRLLARHVNCKWCDNVVLEVVESCASILAHVAAQNTSLRTRLWTQNGARAAVALYTAILRLNYGSNPVFSRKDGSTSRLSQGDGSPAVLSQIDRSTPGLSGFPTALSRENETHPASSCEDGPTILSHGDYSTAVKSQRDAFSEGLSQIDSSTAEFSQPNGYTVISRFKDVSPGISSRKGSSSTLLSHGKVLILQEVCARLKSKRACLRGAASMILAVIRGQMGMDGELGANGGVGVKGEEGALELRLVAGCSLEGDLAEAVWWSATSGSKVSEMLLDACVVYHHLIPAEICRELMIRALIAASIEHVQRRIDLLVWDSCGDENALQRHLSMCRELWGTKFVRNGRKIVDLESHCTKLFFEVFCDRILTTIELYVECLDHCRCRARHIITRALALLGMLADMSRGRVGMRQRTIAVLKDVLGRGGDKARALHSLVTSLMQQMDYCEEDMVDSGGSGAGWGAREYLLPAMEARIRLLSVTRYCAQQRANIAKSIKRELRGGSREGSDDVSLHDLLDSKWQSYISKTPVERIAMVACSLALVEMVTKDVAQWIGAFMTDSSTELHYCAQFMAVMPVGGVTDDVVNAVSTRVAHTLAVRGAECAVGSSARALLALVTAVGGPPRRAVLRTLLAFAAGAIGSGWWEGALITAARRAIAGADAFHYGNVAADEKIADANMTADEKDADENVAADEKVADANMAADEKVADMNAVASLLRDIYDRVRLVARPDAAFTRLLDPMIRHATEPTRNRFLTASLRTLAGDVRAVNARLERTELALRVLFALLNTLSAEGIPEHSWSELRHICTLCVAILRKPDVDNEERLCVQRLAYCVVCQCLIIRRAGERASRGVSNARVWDALEPMEKRPSDAHTEQRSVCVRPSSRAHAPKSSFTLQPVEQSYLHDLFVEISNDDITHCQVKVVLEPHVLATADILRHLSSLSGIEDNPQWVNELKQTLDKARTPVKEMILRAICHIAIHLTPYCLQLLPTLATLATQATNELLVAITEACIQWVAATSTHMQDSSTNMQDTSTNMQDLSTNMQDTSIDMLVSSAHMQVSSTHMQVLSTHAPVLSVHILIPHMRAVCMRLVTVILQTCNTKRSFLLDLLSRLLVVVPDLASEDLLGQLFDDASTRGDTWRVLSTRGVSSAHLVPSLVCRISSHHHAPYRKQIVQLLSYAIRAGPRSQATAGLSEALARLRADSAADWLKVLAILPSVGGDHYRRVTSLGRCVCGDARALCDDARRAQHTS